MGRLRDLNPSAAGRTREGGTPADDLSSAGRMGRRAVLGLLGAAPIVASAAAGAALAAVPCSAPIIGETEWAEYGRASAAWFDANRECLFASGVTQEAEVIEAQVLAERETSSARGLNAVPSARAVPRALPVEGPRAFTDDVGSGP